MKRVRVGIFGKTLLFTCLLLILVSALIVAVFSSVFLQYAKETQLTEQQTQRNELTSLLQGKKPEEVISFLEEHQQDYPEFLFLFVNEMNYSVLWKSDAFHTATVNWNLGSDTSPILLVSQQQSQEEVEQAAAQLLGQFQTSGFSNEEVLEEFQNQNPDILPLAHQASFEVSYDQEQGYIMNFFLQDWVDTSTDSCLRWDADLYFMGQPYRLLVQQTIPPLDPLAVLSQPLLQVFVISILPILLGSFLFAKWMARPIKRLAKDTRSMTKGETVVYRKVSRDEIGDLTQDVRSLYEQLHSTIQNLEQEMKLVKQMETSQRNLFAAASHELKTPVAAITALLEGMLEQVGEYKNHPKYLRECLRITQSMKKLIQELLEIIRLEEEPMNVQLQPVDLSRLLEDKMLLYQTMAEANHQTFTVSIPPGLPCLADAGRLSRALDNIICNALQNTESGREIRIWAEEKKKELLLSVWNQGGYLPLDQISELFQPFFRVDQSRSRKDGHSGLGLAITKRLLDSMHIPFSLSNDQDGVLFLLELQKS